MKTSIVVLVLVVLGAGLSFFVFEMLRGDSEPEPVVPISSYEECVAAGLPVTEGAGRQCSTPDGRIFAQEVIVAPTYMNASADDIRVELPYAGAVTGKSFGVLGEARGGWYFEASFPVSVLAPDGTILASSVATAQGDWMTAEFVPFTAQITVPEPYIGPATLILKRDNASGLPENDGSVSIPITIEY